MKFFSKEWGPEGIKLAIVLLSMGAFWGMGVSAVNAVLASTFGLAYFCASTLYDMRKEQRMKDEERRQWYS